MAQYKQKFNPRTSQFNLVPSTIILFKASVANYAALPLLGNTIGDARITEDTDHWYSWDGSVWNDQGIFLASNWTNINGKPTSPVADIDDAVSKKHTQNTDNILMLTPSYGANFLTGGTPTADTIYGVGYEADKAFDGNWDTTVWASDMSPLPHWIKYDLGVGVTKKARKIKTEAYYDPTGASAKTIEIQGSNDDITYTLITTIVLANTGVEPLGTIQSFEFDNTIAYRYYKFNCLDNYRGEGRIMLYEVEMYELGLSLLIDNGTLKENLAVDNLKKIDDRDLSVDGTKLDGIEASAVSLATVKADIDIADTISKRHTQNTDQKIDNGGLNETSAAEIRDSADKRHTQGTDQKLDEGGANEIAVVDIKDATNKKHYPKITDIEKEDFINLGVGKDWEVVATASGGEEVVNGITYLENGILIAGTGFNLGKILRSTDYGLTWTDLGSQLGMIQLFNSAYLGNGIVICGGQPGLIRSIDYGLTWTKISGLLDYCELVQYLGNGIVLVGQSGEVWRSIDYGLTYTKVLTTSGGWVFTSCYLGEGIVLVGTGMGATTPLYRSIDYGLTWTNLGATAPGEDGVYRLIYLFDGIVLAGTESGGVPANGNGKILRSTNYGLTWTDMGSLEVGMDDISALCHLGNGIVLAQATIWGNIGSYTGETYYSNNTGLTWTKIEPGHQGWLNNFCHLGEGIVLAGTYESPTKILRGKFVIDLNIGTLSEKSHTQNTDIALRTNRLTIDVNGNTTISNEITYTYGANFLTGGIATADSDSFGLVPSLAFDGNWESPSLWYSGLGAFPHWIKYDLGVGVSKIARKMKFRCGDEDGARVRNATIEGSNDDITYDVITSIETENIVTPQEFTFDNDVAYRYYKLNATSSYRVGSNEAIVWEMEMYEGIPSSADILLKVNGNIQLSGNITDGTNASSPANIKDAVDKKHDGTLQLSKNAISGTFITSDIPAKTITVVDGQITSII